MEKISAKIPNKLNLFTVIFSIVFGIVYFMFIVLWKKQNVLFEDALSMSADYVTIVSCVLVLIQLIAFVKDSRQKEYRCRKENALVLAKEYANDLLKKFTFIQTVLSFYYDPDDATALQEELDKIEIDKFTKSFVGKKTRLSKLEKAFLNGEYVIPYEIILERATIHEIDGFLDFYTIEDEDLRKNLANIKFKRLVCDTMNNLEYFTMSVNQNVAESKMLFVSLHQTYLKFIKYVYPYICNNNVDDESLYTNVIDLYRNWLKEKNEIQSLKKKNEVKSTKIIKKNSSSHPL